MDPLEEKATEAVSNRQNKKADKELALYLEDKYNISSKKHIAFFVEYIKTGVAYKAYQNVYGEHINMNSAAVMANRVLKKAKFSISDFLDNTGHGIESMMEVLETLKESDPKEYLKYTVKLRGLDTQKVEHSGKIELPTWNIISEPKEEDE